MNQYYLTIGPKTKLLNLFRQVFRVRVIESLLVKWVNNSSTDSIKSKFIPPNYLYPPNTIRDVTRNEVRYVLDISDYVEHAVYFGLRDPGHETLFDLATNKKVLFDIGTNIGSVLLNFARVSPDGLVFGFEPDIKNFQKASRNLGRNAFSNVSIVNKGLGSRMATERLYRVNEGNEGMNRILRSDDLGDGAYSEIEVITLDSFASEMALNSIDLIKIDVEGFEMEVLRGSIRTLEMFRPVLFIELDDNYLRATGDSAVLLVDFLVERGYSLFHAIDRRPIQRGTDFTNCHFDIVCLPQSN